MAKIKKLKAFTLIESLVSLLLISSVVVVCLLLFNNIGIHDRSRQEARFIADNYYNKLEKGLLSIDNSYFKENGMEVNIQYKVYEQQKNILQVNISVSRGKTLYHSSKKIIILNEN